MHAEMEYGTYFYGNKSNASRYTVKVERHKRGANIGITFRLDEPAGGRGVGSKKGSVRSLTVSLPSETCRALSHGLLVALADIKEGAVIFEIDETSQK